jgi:hypothetical protein
METTTMPFARLGKTTDAVAAMAGGENLAGDQENGPRSHQTRKRQHEGELTERNQRSGGGS